MKENRTVIIGAGLAGLACARALSDAGREFVLCEAADQVGGRVATDVCDGYRLDRGFQVLLTAYPEARRLLDYRGLDLRAFYPGALVRYGGRWHRVADPFRRPLDGVMGVFNPIGSFTDKARVGMARLRGFRFGSGSEDLTTEEALRESGFSGAMIERFFRPFLGGVFLERKLETTAKKLEFVMNHFASGETALPALGMGEIPKQLAASLPDGAVRLRTRVRGIDAGRVVLEDGEELNADAVVVATEKDVASQLLGIGGDAERWSFATCLYFSASSAPIKEPVLMLNGDGVGPVNHLSIPSVVSPDYAPEGCSLISVSVVDPEAAAARDLEDQVLEQLRGWFGAQVRNWKLLRTDRIPKAVPLQTKAPGSPARLDRGIYQCGDHCGIASIDTALASGTAAARAIIEDFA